LVLKARQLHYGDNHHRLLLLTITDVTLSRASEKLKDDLVREKAILLQELQHRVANSLQIIASVLMQNARRVASEETRGHLYEAHNRIMSVATIQRHLVPSRLGDVALRAYFTDLCQSISASMISDPHHLSLEVTADETTVSADDSVSMGLIVTELAINALKHAFPGHRSGKIVVDFRSQPGAWILSVSDDGVGIPEGAFKAKPGLGTGIVDAISKQLGAHVCVADATPGTKISIVHGATN
jgi:two-component sensor histidine kinase